MIPTYLPTLPTLPTVNITDTNRLNNITTNSNGTTYHFHKGFLYSGLFNLCIFLATSFGRSKFFGEILELPIDFVLVSAFKDWIQRKVQEARQIREDFNNEIKNEIIRQNSKESPGSQSESDTRIVKQVSFKRDLDLSDTGSSINSRNAIDETNKGCNTDPDFPESKTSQSTSSTEPTSASDVPSDAISVIITSSESLSKSDEDESSMNDTKNFTKNDTTDTVPYHNPPDPFFNKYGLANIIHHAMIYIALSYNSCYRHCPYLMLVMALAKLNATKMWISMMLPGSEFKRKIAAAAALESESGSEAKESKESYDPWYWGPFRCVRNSNDYMAKAFFWTYGIGDGLWMLFLLKAYWENK